jgi:hypothetical protein
METPMKHLEIQPWADIHLPFSRTARNASAARSGTKHPRSAHRMAVGKSVPALVNFQTGSEKTTLNHFAEPASGWVHAHSTSLATLALGLGFEEMIFART